MPAITFPNIDLTKFELPKFDLPKFDLPEIDADRIAAAARDAAYITVGFGVLAFQRAQVRRQELTKQMHAAKLPVEQVTKFVGDQVRDLDGRIARLESKIDSVVVQVQDRLPSPADDAVGRVHGVARAASKQVRELVLSAI